MIRSLLNLDFLSVLASVIAVILSMSVHEMAHGLVSYWLGDPTAKRMGRLSLNPMAHVDWTGIVCLLLFGFGWAKPVPVDPSYYKDQKTGIIWTSFAGPAANFLLSFVCVFIWYALGLYAPAVTGNSAGTFLMTTLAVTATMSCGFGIFNLLPVPPLDGAKIFWAFLPDDQYYRFMRGTPWMMLLLMVLIMSGLLSSPLIAMRSTLIEWMSEASYWILTLF